MTKIQKKKRICQEFWKIILRGGKCKTKITTNIMAKSESKKTINLYKSPHRRGIFSFISYTHKSLHMNMSEKKMKSGLIILIWSSHSQFPERSAKRVPHGGGQFFSVSKGLSGICTKKKKKKNQMKIYLPTQYSHPVPLLLKTTSLIVKLKVE